MVDAGPRGALVLFGGAGTGPRNDTWRIAHLEVSPVAAAPTALDVGATTTLSVTALGGFGPVTVVWNGLPTGCSTANATVLNCTPTGPGASTNAVSVSVRDPAGEEANSSSAVVLVNARPTVTVAAMPEAGIEPLQVSFLASPSGGTGAITFAWQFGDGAVGLGSNPTHTYVAPGTFTVTVWANDSDGESGTAQTTVSFASAHVVRAVPLALAVVRPDGNGERAGVTSWAWVGSSSTAPGRLPCEGDRTGRRG